MKLILRTLVIVILAAISAIGTAAQQKKEMPAPPVTRIEVPATLQQGFAATVSDIERSRAIAEIAQLRQENFILRARLLLSIPLDFEGQVDANGRLYFEKPKPDPSIVTSPVPPTSRPADSPTSTPPGPARPAP